ncbi:MAG: hypothetical protein ABRQ39_26475 [Candidatus Eremiobacterota bacterium]
MKVSIVIMCFVLVILSCSNSMAFVTRPVDKIPGVDLPTPNPKVPTLPPPPATVTGDNPTPLYSIPKPTSMATPIFQEIDDDDAKEQPGKSSQTLKIVLFILGILVLVGGFMFFYRTKG